jgi:hypothetical protein
MKNLFLLVILFCLTGCAAQVLVSNPRSVTVRASQFKVAEAQTLADVECAKHKRFSRLAIRPTDYTPNQWVFDCIE